MNQKIDRTPSNESISEIDYLREDLKVYFSFEAEAAECLPEVTDEDLASRMEKYRIFTGTAEQLDENSIALRIKTIIEVDDEPGYYTEGIEEVRDVNILKIKRMVSEIRDNNPDYADSNFIGDIHTHPILPNKPYEGFDPSSPSPDDIADIIRNYKSGALSPAEPFIFGIAAPDLNGSTVYSFYRLVLVDGEYKCVELD